MFGLMRPAKNCSGKNCASNCKNKSDYVVQRTHYCGTCKTIGKAYGHKARMLLNFDTVFLAEVLSQLSGEDIQQWAQPYQAINKCFVMPENETNAPASLKFAAAANVVLGALKMDDNIRDKAQVRFAQKRYKFARWFFSKSFKKAAAELESWGVSQTFLWEKVETQTRLEKQPFEGFQFADLNACLDTFAHTTAEMTAEIFAKGALFVQNPENMHKAEKLGYEFGRLAYILDAFEDIEKDVFNGEFNPIAQFFGLKIHEAVPETVLAQARTVLETVEMAAYQAFAGLGLGKNAEEKFTVRLSANLSTRIYKQRTLPQTFAERLRLRWANAKEKAEKLVCKESPTQMLKYAFVVLVLFLLPQIFDAWNGDTTQNKGILMGSLAFFSTTFSNHQPLDAPEETEKLKQIPKDKSYCFLGGCGDCGCSSCEAAGACESIGACCESVGGCCECLSGCGDCGCGGCAC